MPWIQRELQALIPEDTATSNLVLEYVLALMQDTDIGSDSAIQLLQDFLGTHAKQFSHELLSFARSPLGMEAYDQAVTYRPGPSG